MHDHKTVAEACANMMRQPATALAFGCLCNYHVVSATTTLSLQLSSVALKLPSVEEKSAPVLTCRGLV